MTASHIRNLTTFAGATAGAAALLLTAAVPAAASSPPLSGSGEGVITSLEETSSRDAGGNRIAERRLEGVMNGALEGTFVEEVRGVVHGNGQVTFQGTLDFTGTIAGCGSGVVNARLAGQGTAGPNPQTTARFSSVEASSSVRGTGVVVQDGPFLSYDVQYHCR